MCGRARCSLSREEIRAAAHVTQWQNEDDYNPSYNIAPGKNMAVLKQGVVPEISTMKWVFYSLSVQLVLFGDANVISCDSGNNLKWEQTYRFLTCWYFQPFQAWNNLIESQRRYCKQVVHAWTSIYCVATLYEYSAIWWSPINYSPVLCSPIRNIEREWCHKFHARYIWVSPSGHHVSGQHSMIPSILWAMGFLGDRLFLTWQSHNFILESFV